MIPSDEPSRVKMAGRWRRSSVVVVASASCFIVVGGILLLFAPSLLLQNWLPSSSTEERNAALGGAAQVVLLGLGGIIASVGVTLSILRHREELEGAERDRARLDHEKEKERARRDEAELQRILDTDRELRSRFVTAVDLLSATEPIKRSAALYSLGALADDWAGRRRRDEVQVCINVICSYLRAPLSDGAERTPPNEIEVRKVGYSVIARHLKASGDGYASPWGNFLIDLESAYIDFWVDIPNAVLHGGGMLNLVTATIAAGGRLDLSATLDNESLLFLGGVSVRSGGSMVLNTRLNDSARLDAFGVSIEGFVGLMAFVGPSTEANCEGMSVVGNGKAYILASTWADAYHRDAITLQARIEEGTIDLKGAVVDDDGPVRLPDGIRYAISPA
ncbi:hypothetical protein ET445_06610 [Agromyces protaetiae]|uniref:Pentapeptide repeat-containing protein n=1 Tax=Agromyces protaetiae TaxID=2509455 RepID=A0A4P6FF94_9MICO|nr:hypothetical protein [Agromyces protaetiae]QAY73069.1 hypothetical protein ET445_06610 [Agromyces protaetiae]